VREQIKSTALSAQLMPINIEPIHPLDTNNTNVGKVDGTQAIPQADEENFLPDVSSLSKKFSSPQLSMIQEMVGGLEAKLEFEPENFDGWMQLAKSYTVLGNSKKVEIAYRGAALANLQAIEPRVQLADLLLRSVDINSKIPKEVSRLGQEILLLDNRNPDGLFISGLVAENSDDYKNARRYWTQLINILGPKHPSSKPVQERLAKLP
jgi:cytochrome c-type biogenesis protein CcmH/NrfG